MHGGDAIDDGEPQPRAAAGSRRFESRERLEHAFRFVARYAWTAIGDLDEGNAAFLAGRQSARAGCRMRIGGCFTVNPVR